ncbi:uncharacterized protein LOC132883090 [Neoarius graeffei]|uniref:uncharacterized protein LOC132883090 n=1 Tax=Neoarius graeffei TaxID=443677 RepID=UPI00298C5C49|nr:uncharacterized protein LOC132883090 [Neoarius graeffei]
MADTEFFLKKHMCKLIQKIRNPIELADKLYGKITDQMYANIKSQKTSHDMVREIYGCLNSKTPCDITYDWLKKNESELLEDLEKSDTEAEAPQKKRARLENVDETDNNLAGFSDLKEISTFAKLERWVSNPKISQSLISDLEGKLGDKGMEALKKELQDREPKNSLCFKPNDIDAIRKNKELKKFFNTTQSEKIPKLTISMFFTKPGSASLGNKAQSCTDDDERMDTTADLSSSGYESLLSSSLNDSCSKHSSNYLPQNDERLPDEDVLTGHSHTGGMDIMIHENKDNGSQSKATEQLHDESFIQMYHNVKAGAPSQELMSMQDTHVDGMEEPSQRSNLPTHEDELITKKEMPLENVLGSMNRQDTHIGEINKEPQRSNVPNVLNNGAISLFQNLPITRNETPLEDRCGSADLQDTYDGELDEDPQSSNIPKNGGIYLDKNYPITQKEMPLEDRCGSMDTQDANDEMKEPSQRSNVPTHEDESITKKETPLENVLGSMDRQDTHIGEIDREPQRSNAPNVLKNGDISLFQNIPITKKETPLEDRCGSMDMQDTHDEMKEPPQRSNIPTNEDESITENETPLESGIGITDMKEMHIDKMDEEPQRSNLPMPAASLHQKEPIIKSKVPGNMQANMQVNPEPSSAEQLQKNSSGSAFEYTQSSGTEILAQNKDTAIPCPNRDEKGCIKTSKKQQTSKKQKEKKKEEKNKLLREWAVRQCNDHKEDLQNIREQISIINMAEHTDYPCFTAEKVMVYKYLTPESQIIFIADDNTSINTMTKVHYIMFVCNIKKAIVLGPKKPNEQEIVHYDESEVPIDKCRKFIVQAFAPALAVYKKIQKESLIWVQ